MNIGLALGSGAARGWAHIGVLRALADAGIKPDVIAGCSIGALVGGAWASDAFDAFEDWARGISTWDVIRLMDVRIGGGLIQGERLMRSYEAMVPDMDFSELTTTFAAVSTDLATGREVWLTQGALHQAVRASIALPGLLRPVANGEQWLVDGGLTNPVPVSVCRAMGAEVVIAVNLNSDLVGRHQRRRAEQQTGVPAVMPAGRRAELKRAFYQQKSRLGRLARKVDMRVLDGRIQGLWQDESNAAPGMLEVMAGSINIMQDRITKSRMAGDPPDYMIAPKLAHMGLLDFEEAGEAIAAGAAATQPVIDALQNTD